jgi:methionyl aminopeptidase
MSIKTAEELAGMERAGRVTRAVLEAMKAAVRPGITTRMLDDLGAVVMRSLGARSAPNLVYGFPGHSCISVNEEIVHGVPGKRVLVVGDLVKLDVTVEVGGYMADACETVGVGQMNVDSRRLMDCAKAAFFEGLSVVRPGARAYEIGKAVHSAVRGQGYSVVKDLTGHGIGRTIHEAPTIPNLFDPRCSAVLTAGMVFTIEPLIAIGTHKTVTLRDGWTIRTRDRTRAAHHEHTVLVTHDGARLLTA